MILSSIHRCRLQTVLKEMAEAVTSREAYAEEVCIVIYGLHFSLTLKENPSAPCAAPTATALFSSHFKLISL